MAMYVNPEEHHPDDHRGRTTLAPSRSPGRSCLRFVRKIQLMPRGLLRQTRPSHARRVPGPRVNCGQFAAKRPCRKRRRYWAEGFSPTHQSTTQLEAGPRSMERRMEGRKQRSAGSLCNRNRCGQQNVAIRMIRMVVRSKQSPACEPGLGVAARSVAYFVAASLPNWPSNGL